MNQSLVWLYLIVAIAGCAVYTVTRDELLARVLDLAYWGVAIPILVQGAVVLWRMWRIVRRRQHRMPV